MTETSLKRIWRGATVLAVATLIAAAGVHAAEQGPTWVSLSPAQRQALAPLAGEWQRIDAPRKQKWLEIASRFPAMPAAERERVRERMVEWAAMSPAERNRARLNFQDAKQLSTEQRQARWEAYLALPSEQREQFTASGERKAAGSRAPNQAAAVRPPAAGAAGTARPPGSSKPKVVPASSARREGSAPRDARPKTNLAPNPLHAAPPEPVAPSLVQAQPGASTRLITQQPSPPLHQQAGLPKIVATPEFVDPKTLLPQRGPQSAGAQPRAAQAPQR